MDRSRIPDHAVAIGALSVLVLFVAAGCAYVTEANLEITPCRSASAFPTPSPLDIDYRVVYRVADLPDAVTEVLTPMADPGEAYNATDVVDPGLPMQRLTLGGYSKDRALVYFEQGGFAPVQCLVFFRFQEGRAAEIVYATRTLGGATDLEQLRDIYE